MIDSIPEYIVDAIEKMQKGQNHLSLVSVCNAVDATAKKEYPQSPKIGERYVNFISDNMRIITTAGFGVQTSDFRFRNIFKNVKGMEKFNDDKDVSIKDLVYCVVRCGLIHSATLPKELSFHQGTSIKLENQSLVIPISLVWGLVFAVVGAPSNTGNISGSNLSVKFPSEELIQLDLLWGQKAKIKDLLGVS